MTVRTGREISPMIRTIFLAILAASLTMTNVAHADFASGTIKIGVLTDLSGPYEGNGGHGSVAAAEIAAQEFGNNIDGAKIEIVAADHQNKPDIGAAIASRWFDVEHVDTIADLINSAVAFAVLNVAKERGKLLLLTSAGSADFTGKACAPDNLVQWIYDTYAVGSAAGEAMPYLGKTWFFITADYVFGKGVQAGTTRAIEARGGKVLGSVLHPIGTSDFSSYILQAQASGADVIALANGGQDTMNAIKAAHEFGVKAKLFPGFDLTEIKAMGLANAQGTLYVAYWNPNLNDRAHAFFQKFLEKTGKPVSDFQVGTYSAVRSYLLAVKATHSTDPKTVLTQLRKMKIDDAFTDNGYLRPDGRMIHDVYLLQVNRPDQARGPYDWTKVVATLPGDKVFRPIDALGGCPAFAKK
jgi:branched-chain amino acid transport system substrate-binding protein